MEQRECERCGSYYEHDNQNVTLCEKCDDLVTQARDLVDKDPKINKQYNDIVMQQQKAVLRIHKLMHLYENNKTEVTFGKALKKTGKAAKKAFEWNVVDVGINATKRILSKEDASEEKEIDVMMEETIMLQEFVSTNPIEFIIYDHLTPESEKKPKIQFEEDTKNQKNFFQKNFVTNSIFTLAVHKFNKLDKDKQVKFGIGSVITFCVILLVVCILL